MGGEYASLTGFHVRSIVFCQMRIYLKVDGV